MRDVNRCRIYIQAFYTSDITDLAGKATEDWAKQEKRQGNRTSKWNWAVQQRPTSAARKNLQLALQGITSEDGDSYQQLGPWGQLKNIHQSTEWNLYTRAMSL
jgi:hypothetical protein